MNQHGKIALLLALIAAPSAAKAVEFDRIVIDNNFPGAYQVEVADVNGDKKPDVIAVGGGTCAWYENPTWKKRIVTNPKQTPGIISSATADLDGDGKAEIAIAYEFSMNEPTRGKLLLATQGKTFDDPWTVTPVTARYELAAVDRPGTKTPPPPPIANLGSIHRLRWGAFFGLARPISDPLKYVEKTQLVVAPIFGPSAKPPVFDQEPAHLMLLDPGDDPKSGRWTYRILGEAPVLHAIDVPRIEGPVSRATILGASNLGVISSEFMTFDRPPQRTPIFRFDILVLGAFGDAPKKGASEIHVGRLKDGRWFLATVEPWHGTDVAIYFSRSKGPNRPSPGRHEDGMGHGFGFHSRDAIDTTLKEGHALWIADVDLDGDDEVFAGYRGPGTSVLMYAFDRKTETWDRTVVDSDIAAQDLRGGDIDGDGRPDVVAVGGKTHNVVWYRPKK